jgi:hypothetical protein
MRNTLMPRKKCSTVSPKGPKWRQTRRSTYISPQLTKNRTPGSVLSFLTAVWRTSRTNGISATMFWTARLGRRLSSRCQYMYGSACTCSTMEAIRKKCLHGRGRRHCSRIRVSRWASSMTVPRAKTTFSRSLRVSSLRVL